MPDSEQTPLDLIELEMFAPRLRRIAFIAIVIGVALGFLLSLLLPMPLAVLIAVVLAGPPAVASLLRLRIRTWLSGTVVRARRSLWTQEVDLAKAVTVELYVRAGRMTQVGARVGDGTGSVAIDLAMYLGNAGRELNVLALRKLADALSASDIAPAATLTSVLVEQLKAEARDAVLGERPLYRAARLARDSGRIAETTLTDAEVARLLD